MTERPDIEAIKARSAAASKDITALIAWIERLERRDLPHFGCISRVIDHGDRLEIMPALGVTIGAVAYAAVELARYKNLPATFKFNDLKFEVLQDSDPDKIDRDYFDAIKHMRTVGKGRVGQA